MSVSLTSTAANELRRLDRRTQKVIFDTLMNELDPVGSSGAVRLRGFKDLEQPVWVLRKKVGGREIRMIFTRGSSDDEAIVVLAIFVRPAGESESVLEGVDLNDVARGAEALDVIESQEPRSE